LHLLSGHDPSPFSLLDTCTVIIEFDFVHLIQLPSTHSFSHPLVRKIRRQASYLQAVHKYWYISFSRCLPIAQLKICLVKTRLYTQLVAAQTHLCPWLCIACCGRGRIMDTKRHNSFRNLNPSANYTYAHNVHNKMCWNWTHNFFKKKYKLVWKGQMSTEKQFAAILLYRLHLGPLTDLLTLVQIRPTF